MEDAARARIIHAAAELFNAKGYRSVTLSELAARLGMSKKTLYQFFSGKEEIAAAVLERAMNAIAGKVAEITSREDDPVRLFEETFRGIKQEISSLSPLFLEDVQKHLPELWGKVESFRARQLSFIEHLLQRAQQAGIAREVPVRLVAVLMTESIQHFVRPDFAARHGVAMADIADTLFTLFIESIRIRREP
ncbi:TetR/AcrR family transcriptional regulator [Paenibacillus ginsengihumi]|uniref:TetR/AcrR family transcriptional regulator n=1 Tax=Paenibacillus ginsengihumi TaxID=431596 RepID=UPI00036A3561|nr:TetR/AcrR family transcriptional regulator [Paenibacillus ginsengihumi]